MSSSTRFPACFRPSTDDAPPPPPSPLPSPAPESTSNNTNLTTFLYQTSLGQFSLTWSRSFLGHSLHLQLLHPTTDHRVSPIAAASAATASVSFHLNLKPFNFWKKHGSKKLPVAHPTNTPIQLRLYWDLTKARFAQTGPEPVSNFYIAAVVDHDLVLLVGDQTKPALFKTKPVKKPYLQDQSLILRREHVYGDRTYTTRARLGGKNREIIIDCSLNSDARLSFNVDKERVLLVKRLKWKFRGSEKVEVGGVPVNISWDVYNWLFQGNGGDGHAVFMFKFETLGVEEVQEEEEVEEKRGGGVLWKRQGKGEESGRFGLMMMGMRSGRRTRTERSSSSSSISMSSGSSFGGGSSVVEWSSVEENELLSPVGFSLLVHAWRK